MGKCKTKAIQTDSNIFRHNQAYPGIIQAHSGMFRTLRNPGILNCGISRTMTYSPPWYIQNPGLFRTLAYSKFKKRFAKIVNGYNYFDKF